MGDTYVCSKLLITMNMYTLMSTWLYVCVCNLIILTLSYRLTDLIHNCGYTMTQLHYS